LICVWLISLAHQLQEEDRAAESSALATTNLLCEGTELRIEAVVENNFANLMAGSNPAGKPFFS